jgi:hypothetical protein
MHRNLWIKLAKIWGQVGGGQLAVGGRDPPHGRFGGGDCGGTKHLQKKFFKKIKNKLNKQVKLCKNVNSTNNGVNE